MAALFLPAFSRYQYMQRLGYLHELGNKLVIVPGEPQEAPDLGDSDGVGHFLIMFIFSSSVTIPWAEMMCSHM